MKIIDSVIKAMNKAKTLSLKRRKPRKKANDGRGKTENRDHSRNQ